MTQGSTRLATLVGSRICHDLISPVGAVMNGLEMMQLAGDSASPEMDLIGDSVANATARIRFFRVAYGAAGDDHAIGAAEIRDILAGLDRAGRVRHDWQVPHDVSRAEARLAFLGIQALETALPRGGAIDIGQRGDGRLWLRATGSHLACPPGMAAMLRDGPPSSALSPATVPFALLAGLMDDAGRLPTLEGGAEADALTLRL